MKKYSITEWDGGIDQISIINSPPFQLPNPDVVFEDRSKQYLREAYNVILDDSSKPITRLGLSLLENTTDCLALHPLDDSLFFQDGAELKLRTSAGVVTTVKSLNSSSPLSFFDYTDGTYFYSSTDIGRIVDGAVLNWGCSVCPTPTLSLGAGALPAGIYKVAATFIDATGIEHAADEAAIASLASPAGITVDVPTLDSYATHVNVYASKANHIGLYYVATVAVGALPYTITDVAVEEYRLDTQFLSPPEAVDSLFDYNGALMSCTNQYAYPSLGANHHVFDKTLAVEARPSDIFAGAGLNGGFWTVGSDGAFWTTGTDPVDWDTNQIDDFRYAKGSAAIPGHLLGFVKSQQPVALFVSEHGLSIGTNTGAMLAVNHHNIHLDVEGKRAFFAYDRASVSNQIIFFLE